MKIIFIFLFLPILLSGQTVLLQTDEEIFWKEQISELSEPSQLAVDFNGNVLITDAFNNTIIQYSPQTGDIKNAGAESNFSPLSNPRQIVVLPLEIWVLDYDNQRLLRYDQWMRLFESLEFSRVSDLPGNVSISSFAVDKNHYFYLLDELESVLYKVDSQNRVVLRFGGRQSLEPDWGNATRMERVDNRLFVTWAEEKGLVFFDDQGNEHASLPLSGLVSVMAGNGKGLWLAVTDTLLWVGQDEKIMAQLFKPSDWQGVISVAFQPGQDTGWLITQEKLLRFSLQLPASQN